MRVGTGRTTIYSRWWILYLCCLGRRRVHMLVGLLKLGDKGFQRHAELDVEGRPGVVNLGRRI